MLATPARAEFVMCIQGQGASPPLGSIVPPRAHVAFYTDRNMRAPSKVSATIDGVAVKATMAKLAPSGDAAFQIVHVQIDSDRTGKLVITYDGAIPATYI